MRSLFATVAALATLLPAPAAGQLVLRDDAGGWGWLGMIQNRRAVAQLSFGNPQSGRQGRLDAQLLSELAERGVARVHDASTFDAAISQVMAECTATDRTAPGSTEVYFAMHAEVSYWDHTRLAATEIFESIRLAAVPPAEFTPDAYVQACAEQLTDVLTRLGFSEG
jgi:hypothetical protein